MLPNQKIFFNAGFEVLPWSAQWCNVKVMYLQTRTSAPQITGAASTFVATLSGPTTAPATRWAASLSPPRTARQAAPRLALTSRQCQSISIACRKNERKFQTANLSSENAFDKGLFLVLLNQIYFFIFCPIKFSL